jgi:hypothetical protein
MRVHLSSLEVCDTMAARAVPDNQTRAVRAGEGWGPMTHTLGLSVDVVPAADVPVEVAAGDWIMSSVSVHPARAALPSLMGAWRSWVAIARHGGSVVGAVTLQQRRTLLMPGPKFDPMLVAPSIFDDRRDPRDYLYIGGGSDLVAGVATTPGLDPAACRQVRRAVVSYAVEHARSLGLRPVALYVRDAEIDDFTAGGNGLRAAAVATLSVARTRVNDAAYLSSLTSNQRRTVRRDRERMVQGSLRYEVKPAHAALDAAPQLVVNVKSRYGVKDHPKLARLRLTEWAEEDVGERLAYLVSDRDRVLAVSFGVSYRGRLEIHETGLVDEHEFRHEAYVQSMIYGPLEHAMMHGMASVEFGLDSPTPKTRRGAVPVTVWAAG